MSVLQHVVRTRLASEREDVATEALAYILRRSGEARLAFAKLLRSLVPDLPDGLTIETQSGSTLELGDATALVRPDMVASSDGQPYVLVENKFWAGLTDQQPAGYLEVLARGAPRSTALLFVAPAARDLSVWHELLRRLAAAGIGTEERPAPVGIRQVVGTSRGPAMALTTWQLVLDAIALEASGDEATMADLAQLRALCVASDAEAFAPLAADAVTDQSTAAFILRLVRLTQAVVELGVERGALSVGGLRPQANWERVGQYAQVVDANAGLWLGVHFQLWRDVDATPLWVVFSDTAWGQGSRVRMGVERWARTQNRRVHDLDGQTFAVGVEVPVGLELQVAAGHVLDQVVAMTGSRPGAGG